MTKELAHCPICKKEFPICQCPTINRGSFAKYVEEEKMNKWRPDNWDSPYPSKPSFVAQREAFEAGADALVDALLDLYIQNANNIGYLPCLFEALRVDREMTDLIPEGDDDR